MKLNADFSERVAVHAGNMPWRPSPTVGVERRMLDRVGDEIARATTIVKFEEGSAFPEHVHGGGEEFLVLDGVFQDEHGDFPTGSYIRNPPTSKHTPSSAPGCTIFVKLWQFDPADRTEVKVHIDSIKPIETAPGRATRPLFKDDHEDVRIEDWAPGADIPLDAEGGMEILVIGGGFTDGDELFTPHSWLRLPIDGTAAIKAGANGAKVWIKSGHLRHVD